MDDERWIPTPGKHLPDEISLAARRISLPNGRMIGENGYEKDGEEKEKKKKKKKKKKGGEDEI